MLNRFNIALRSALLLALAATALPAYTLLVVFAHPDAETPVAGMLAKYAAEGHTVHIVYTTSGQDGNANTPLPKGEELGRVREGEARCASKALGVDEPIFLGFMDGDTGGRDTIEAMVVKLREVVDRVRPDVIVTSGPDGFSGHPDNRVTSVVATEVFQQRELLRHHPRKLYYTARPASAFPDGPPAFLRGKRPFLTVADEFITTTVDGSSYGPQIAAAVNCNDTQFDEQRKKDFRELWIDRLNGHVYLRLAMSDAPAAAGPESSVFERLP